MRFFLILLSALVFGCQTDKKTDCNYITDYYPHTAKAEIELYLGNYEMAFEYYQNAFESCNAIKIATHHDTDNFAKICAELGKEDLALDYIEKTIRKGGTLYNFQEDEVFDNLFKTVRGKKIISEYDKYREEYINSLNMNLRSELQNMIELDQKFNSTKFQDSMFKVNDKRLVEIFETYGYPNEQMIGNYGIDFKNSNPSILLLHTDDSIRINYFIPKIKEFIKKGKCPPFVLGAMYDNLALFNDEPQTHGTYRNQNGNYSNMISDLSKVNENRAEIGLPSLEMTRKIDSLRKIKYGF
jgi:tetratricopeptide (TPR) repeat protein